MKKKLEQIMQYKGYKIHSYQDMGVYQVYNEYHCKTKPLKSYSTLQGAKQFISRHLRENHRNEEFLVSSQEDSKKLGSLQIECDHLQALLELERKKSKKLALLYSVNPSSLTLSGHLENYNVIPA